MYYYTKLKYGDYMKSFILVTVLMISSFSATLNASGIYFQGQKEYLKQCRDCHRESAIFVKKFTISHWSELLDNEGDILSSMHTKLTQKDIREEDDVQDTIDYFNSKRYLKKVKHLKTFVIRFAKDSDIKQIDILK